MNKVIHDESQILDFSQILPENGPLETYFVSLSSRAKYLTEAERLHYGASRNEMFCQKIIRKKNRIIKAIRGMETNPQAYVMKNGDPIPAHSLVCYINIDTSSTVKALSEFKGIISKYELELTMCMLDHHNPENIMERFNKADKLLIDCYQRNKGTKKFIDVDFDVPKTQEYQEMVADFCQGLLEKDIRSYIIDTRSGYHVLFERKNLKFNYNEKIKEMSDYLKLNGDVGEIVHNNNAMIPMPGTYQGGYPVTFRMYEEINND